MTAAQAPLGCVAGWQHAHARQTREPLVLLLDRDQLAEWVERAGPCGSAWPPSLADAQPAACQLGGGHRSDHEHLPRGASTAGAVIRW